MNIKPITLEEGVIIRDFLSKIGPTRLKDLITAERPPLLTREELIANSDSAVSRVASMQAGFDSAVDAIFEISATRRKQELPSGHEDMTG